jgi:phosphoribosylaminoimidazole-succinocarboxamide synthase
LIDEVLTPGTFPLPFPLPIRVNVEDSSRFWPKDKYVVGRGQESFDKQYLRDWLTSNGLAGVDGVDIPPEVVEETGRKYAQVYQILTGKQWIDKP